LNPLPASTLLAEAQPLRNLRLGFRRPRWSLCPPLWRLRLCIGRRSRAAQRERRPRLGLGFRVLLARLSTRVAVRLVRLRIDLLV